jgi:ParB/RepB/Spo0J family partition protein
MDTLAHLIGRNCVLWWRDAAGEQAKTDGVLQYDRRQARPYRVGTIDFDAGEALRSQGATIFLTTPIALAVVRESEPGVALAVAGSAAEARREANRLSGEHPDVCIVRARTPAPEKATPQAAVDAPPGDTGEAATPNDTLYLTWTHLRPSGLNGLVRGELAPGAPDVEELAASIRDHGVIQNLVVVELDPPEDGAGYEVLVGERRWLACRRLGDAAPPLPCSVVPRPASDLEALLLMGAENMQRKNLSPLEEARYFQALIDRLPDREKLKPAAALARRLRKRRRYVEDRLALLDLEAEVKEEVGRGTIAPGAARYLACLAGDDQVEVAVQARGLKAARVKQLVEAKQRARGDEQHARAPAVAFQPLAATPGVELPVFDLAVRATCGACLAAGVPSPAGTAGLPWDGLQGAFAAACQACPVSEIRDACLDCPLVEFLRALSVLLQGRGALNALEVHAPDHLYQHGILERRSEPHAGANGSQLAAAQTAPRPALVSLVA